ncbi:ribosomal L7Ae/L30e/S12e/Gadd45 family protein [Clostridium sp. SYSU_GA19001]|uniref:ribosomal L7Ae/L30e/S12e/Gadd45 family protein n=1 Tax=Clostridium caldaquaticum TaxID=2940653 RepID=UPI0020778837|nr:ribosomal L7Ae/L30e/S12e/Gadd45 family protein [Clostridium caldaquaticum]MCM8710626.1 ribosomal L7Ae/L30e/S12e/Gadd45 family protein [Clostridium caldaquaticum]
MQDKFLQFLGITKKSGSLLEGYNKCEEAIKSGKLFLLILSDNCSENTKEKFIKYCNKYNVPFVQAYSKEDLGTPIGRTEINILGIADKNMSIRLVSLWNEKNKI